MNADGITEQPLATLVDPGTLRYERTFGHPAERVWHAIATPEGVGSWLATAVVEPTVGGAVRLRWEEGETMTGEVLVWDPPHVLEYTWNEVLRDGRTVDAVVRFELTAAGDSTVLVLTHRRLPAVSGFDAGWHAHLDVLAGVLDGREVSWRSSWDAARPRYAEAFAARG